MERIMRSYRISHLEVEAEKGVRLESFILDIMTLAFNENRVVVGKFNDTEYRVDPSSLAARLVVETKSVIPVGKGV